MKIFLIGFMGSGKTTIGKKLASKLNMEFVDLDKKIEEAENKSIQDIFDNNGEEYFRELERQNLKELIEKENIVVSTGGGTPCHFDNMSLMNQAGLTVYLEMSSRQLLHRVMQGKARRPLLKGKSEEELAQFIEKRLNDRMPYYEKAHLVVNGFGLKVNDLVEKITMSEQ